MDRMREPHFTVSRDDKFAIVQRLVPPLAESLANLSNEGVLTADDFIDTLTMALGALLANDTNLKTPRDQRLAAELVGKYVEQHTKGFLQLQEQDGGQTIFQKLVHIEAERGPPN